MKRVIVICLIAHSKKFNTAECGYGRSHVKQTVKVYSLLCALLLSSKFERKRGAKRRQELLSDDDDGVLWCEYVRVCIFFSHGASINFLRSVFLLLFANEIHRVYIIISIILYSIQVYSKNRLYERIHHGTDNITAWTKVSRSTGAMWACTIIRLVSFWTSCNVYFNHTKTILITILQKYTTLLKIWIMKSSIL